MWTTPFGPAGRAARVDHHRRLLRRRRPNGAAPRPSSTPTTSISRPAATRAGDVAVDVGGDDRGRAAVLEGVLQLGVGVLAGGAARRSPRRASRPAGRPRSRGQAWRGWPTRSPGVVPRRAARRRARRRRGRRRRTTTTRPGRRSPGGRRSRRRGWPAPRSVSSFGRLADRRRPARGRGRTPLPARRRPAARSTSAPGAPTSWIPTGRPSPSKPAGSDMRRAAHHGDAVARRPSSRCTSVSRRPAISVGYSHSDGNGATWVTGPTSRS